MKEEEILAVLRLQSTKYVGDILAKKLIATAGSAEAVFSEKRHVLQKIQGVGSHIVQHLLDEARLNIVEKEFEYILKNKIQYSYFLEKDYPQKLQHCIDAPILLFRDGNIDLSYKKIRQ